MSGGSYHYLCFKDAGELVNAGDEDLKAMIERLAGLGYAEDAAQESMTVLAEIRASRVRVSVLAKRLSNVWHAIEWWDSADYGEAQVKAALDEYRGGSRG